MTTLPTYARTPFQRQVVLDLLAMWGALGSTDGCGTDAVYKPGGSGAGTLVRVYLSQKPLADCRPGLGQPQSIVSGVASQQKRFWLCALVKEPGTAEAGGVGSDGGITNLQRGDTFLVSAIAGGDPAAAGGSVTLKIGDKPRIVNGVQWGAEANP